MNQKKLNEAIMASIEYMLKPYGVSISDVSKNPVIEGKQWFNYYKFKSKEQFEDWKEQTISIFRKHAKVSKSTAKKYFNELNFQYGLSEDYTTEPETVKG
jgi:hypothetical protein